MNARNQKRTEVEIAIVSIATNLDTCPANVQNQKKKEDKVLVVLDLQMEVVTAVVTIATNPDTFHVIAENQENQETTHKVEMVGIAVVTIATNPDTFLVIVENQENQETILQTEPMEEIETALSVVNLDIFQGIVKAKAAATEIANGEILISHLGMTVASRMEVAIKIMMMEIQDRLVLSAGKKDIRVTIVQDFDKEFVCLF